MLFFIYVELKKETNGSKRVMKRNLGDYMNKIKNYKKIYLKQLKVKQ